MRESLYHKEAIRHLEKTYHDLLYFERDLKGELKGIYFLDKTITTKRMIVKMSGEKLTSLITLESVDDLQRFQLSIYDGIRWGKLVIPNDYILSDQSCVALFDCNLEITTMVYDQNSGHYHLKSIYTDKVGIRRRHAIECIIA